MAATMQSLRASTAAPSRPMAAAFTPARCVKHVRRAVVVRAVDEDAELEARLAKLRAAKGQTTDAEKRQKRADKASGIASGGLKPVNVKPQYDFTGETLYWEGGPAKGDLVFNLVMGTTIVWLPLTFGSIGRQLFLKYKFTDRRLSVFDTFPGSGKQTDVAYQEVTEVRTVPRALGAWGDMVVVLRNGDKLELLGIEKFQEIKAYILERRDALTGRAAAADKSKAPSIMDLDADDAAVGLGGGKPKGKGFSS
ncbi:MAG: hypothetical protein J3K34DRAFT_412257 [Monoraphidium minutum]|nr:MAG: hypothetical protein J3K34DRAFT_412257 [Monoraphidium minutum]